LIDDGNGNGIGLCTACAKERGRTGLTNSQFELAWPRLQSVFRSRIMAAKKAIEREESKEQGTIKK
jgi:hypothetical protein